MVTAVIILLFHTTQIDDSAIINTFKIESFPWAEFLRLFFFVIHFSPSTN